MATEASATSSPGKTSGGAASAPRAFRHGGASFSAKLDGFARQRLRLASSMIAATAAFVLVATALQFAVGGASFTAARYFALAQVPGALVALVGTLSMRAALARWALQGRALAAADVVLFLLALYAPVRVLESLWTVGGGFAVHFMIVVIFARAVLVPSAAVRTFVLAMLAPFTVAVVAVAHGGMFRADGSPDPDPGFTMLWTQTVLVVSAGIAALASHTNFALRLAAHEAGKVGQYELEEKIGEGAMGEVWRARHGLLRRPTAVKLIRGEIVDDKTRKRFEHEVRQTCRLSHPNVIAIYDYGHSEDGVFFYAMELLDGEDLGRVVRETGPMPASRVIHVLVQACEALAEAHAASLVHRDVKPANIMVVKRGLAFDVVKVMDFGLVKDTGAGDSGMTGVGEICGTPETIAPETIRGKAVGPAADLYALGAVGCRILTGHDVFDAATPLEFVAAHLHKDPTPPSQRLAGVPADLEAVLLSCLKKDPEDRPASALALREALLACADAGRWTQRDAAEWWAARTAKSPFETLPEAPAA